MYVCTSIPLLVCRTTIPNPLRLNSTELMTQRQGYTSKLRSVGGAPPSSGQWEGHLQAQVSGRARGTSKRRSISGGGAPPSSCQWEGHLQAQVSGRGTSKHRSGGGALPSTGQWEGHLQAQVSGRGRVGKRVFQGVFLHHPCEEASRVKGLCKG